MTRGRSPHDSTADALRRSEETLSGVQAQLAEATAAFARREQRMALIDDLNAILHACNSSEEAYPLLATVATRLFPHMNGALALCDHASQLKTVAQWGSRRLMASDFALDDCWALRCGQMHIVDEPGRGAACLHFTSTPEGTSVCLPLVVHSDTLGLLHLDGDAGLDADERRLVVRFGEVVKIALADLKLRDHLRMQVIRDPLTGLFNRLYLDETLPRECQLAERRKSVLSVAMLDIDHFKRFNDDYGHEAGDEVLRAIGEILRTGVRSSDIACRYGGEEFVLVLLDTEVSAAVLRLEDICLAVKKRQCVCRGRTLPGITLSAGVAEFPADGDSPADILRAADDALYAAKKGGRDRVVASANQRAKQPVASDA